ncbi:unnamed protein product [Leptidea sinapis]|uniref:Uncharacterized protein n=1 Tax=Leptidea sinapis TaxID=189913 RepID=A0A5E4Q355_9NEOP|nr:unnamed protein product [Leptidea sinapis]
MILTALKTEHDQSATLCTALLQNKTFTFRNVISSKGLECQACSQRGHTTLVRQYLYIMACRMDANGVTPIPAATSTACSAWKMWEEAAPYGPSNNCITKFQFSMSSMLSCNQKIRALAAFKELNDCQGTSIDEDFSRNLRGDSNRGRMNGRGDIAEE